MKGWNKIELGMLAWPVF